jgi:hypothetical protein
MRSHAITVTFEDGTTVSLREALDGELVKFDDLLLAGLDVMIVGLSVQEQMMMEAFRDAIATASQ